MQHMSSTTPEIQKILVTLSEPDLVAEPGTSVKLSVTMVNQQAAPDRLVIEIEGVDIEWYNIPVPAVNVAAGATAEERVNFRIARSSANRAGSYPFVVRVQAMETGEVGVAQAMLTVKPFGSLQTDMAPRRAAATFLRPLNDFDVQITNLGNSEQVVELSASDPDDECAYEFDVDRLNLKPGEVHTIPLAVRPKVSAWLGNPRLFGFTVWARSMDDSYVAGKTQGQIERYALLSPVVGLLLVVVLLGTAGYALFRPPKPPITRIVAFNITPQVVTAGAPVTLSWNVQGEHLKFTLSHREVALPNEPSSVNETSNQAVYDVPPNTSSGNLTVTPTLSNHVEILRYTLTAKGTGGHAESTAQVQVNPAPLPPPPTLQSFTADSTEIHLGEPVTFTWQGKNAGAYILDPGDKNFSSFTLSTEVKPAPPTLPSSVTYTLRAMPLTGSNGMPAQRVVHIEVVSADTCVARIVGFNFQPKKVVTGGTVTLKWAAIRSQGVSITSDQGTSLGTNLPSSGSLQVQVNTPTTFEVTAADNLGKTVTQSITVTPVPPVPPAPTGSTSPAAGNTTAPPQTPTPQVPGAPGAAP